MPDHVKVPQDLEMHEFWVAKIKEIRAASKDDVCILVYLGIIMFLIRHL